MNPIMFTIGNFELRWYSVLILCAVICVFILSEREASRFNIKKDFMFNLIFWGLIFGIIGARLYYCIFEYNAFKDNLLDIFKVWEGGLAIHGGIIFGLITVILYCKKYNVRVLRITDILCVPLLLGQAIGRWGNFFNQEAHGAATNVETLKRLFVPDFVIKGMNIDGVTYMPSFFFESIICFIAFIILLFVRRGKYNKVGMMTALYLVIYGTLRFFIEMGRTDSLMIGGFKMAQIVSVVMVLIGIGMLMFISRKGRFEDLYNDPSNVDDIKF